MISPAALPLFPMLPLLAAAVLVLLRVPWLERALLIGLPALSSVGGVVLIVQHADTPAMGHAVGAFAGGIAIPLVSDTFTAVMLTVTGLTSATAAVFLVLTGEDRRRFLPSLALMLTAGVNGALLTGDLFNLFVFIEVMLLPSYALVAMTGSWRRLGVGRLFVLVNLLTSTILLLGVGFVYGVAGTANLGALAGRAGQDPRLGAALAVVLLALAIKGGAVPVHGWLPRAYPATSAGVMALFSGVHTKVALYALFRVYAVTFGADGAHWAPVLVAVAVVTIVVGAVSTAAERRLRGAFAYQMVSGVGHILIGVAVAGGFAYAAGIFYMAHHIVTMGALLLASGAIEHTYGTGRYDRLSGLMRREPVIATVLALGMFSLVGLPPMSGLPGKVGLVVAAASADPIGATLLIGSVILASLASMVALQRLWGTVFWGPPMTEYRPDDAAHGRGHACPLPDDVRVPARFAAPGVALTLVSVAMFVFIGALVPIVQRAGADLTDLQPYIEAVLS